ncbi:MAG: adenylosuccinate lyase [Actinobacteria bacterium]|nr:adenylosuccinate lyase [Actinomycetota bacterium]
MIQRYQTEELKKIWSEENKFQTWLEVELAVIKAYELTGVAPSGTSERIRKNAKINVKRIEEIEKSTNHDVIAFVNSIIEQVEPEDGKWFHYGLTSSDIVDTALSLLTIKALDVIIKETERLKNTIKNLAIKEAETLMIGRTHGVHAEPTTFGHKMAVWFFETKRNLKRLEFARENIAYGKISGAVGTYSNISPEIEKIALELLGLNRSPASTQILQRDRHAQVITTLAICASSLEKFATEIRHLQRTEVLEAEEPFGKGQKGSSAMPHKKNPIICERISGLARLVRGYAITSMENISLWHERDISHSSTERVIFPDATFAVHYATRKMNEVLTGLKINKERMLKNLESTRGLVFSSRLLLYLISKGASRPEAYDIVQRCAMKTWENEDTNLLDETLKDEEAKKFVSENEVRNIFDYRYFIRNVPEIIQRIEKEE